MAIMLKSKVKKGNLLKEDRYPANVSSVNGKPTDTDPKKIAFGFRIPGHEPEVFKELPASFEMDSPLLKDVSTILGKEFTKTEIEAGVDVKTLVGNPCSVMIMHKSGSGGRATEVVSLVLPAVVPPAEAPPVETPTTVAPAAEAPKPEQK